MSSIVNSPGMYLLCGSIIAFVAVICIVFLVRAWRHGIAIGMDRNVLKNVVTSSISFSVLPSVGILLGVIALSGALGIPWPWLRLSVIGALHYETQVAAAAAEQAGMNALTIGEMTPTAFATICLLMSVCIMWGMVLSVLFNKKYSQKVADSSKKSGGFGDKAMDAMFIGLVSCYIGSYIGSWVSGNGPLLFNGDWLPLAVAIVAALAMGFFTWVAAKKKIAWLENFSLAASMFTGMASAVLLNMFV